MYFAILILLAVLMVPFAFWAMKNTPFELSFQKSNYSGFFLFMELFLTVIPAVLIIEGYGVHYFRILKYNTGSSQTLTSYIVIYSVALFFITIKFASGFVKVSTDNNEIDDHKYFGWTRFVTWVFLVSGLVIVFILQFIFNVQHGFFEVLSGSVDSIKTIRLESRYSSNAPTVLFSFLKFIYLFIAVLVTTTCFDKKKIQRFLIIFGGVYLATLLGSKGPLLNYFILLSISYIGFHSHGISLKVVLRFLIFIPMSVFLLLIVLSLQYGDSTIDESLDYLFVRIGVGQMIGSYEQFDLGLNNPQYMLQSLPFSAMFKNWPNYNKDIMVISQNVADPTTTGVANSLFIAEAHAIGGIIFALFSPVLVALSYLLSFKIFHTVATMTILRISISPRLSALVFTSFTSLTGGFTGWPAFKIAFMLVIFVFAIWLAIRALIFMAPEGAIRLPVGMRRIS